MGKKEELSNSSSSSSDSDSESRSKSRSRSKSKIKVRNIRIVKAENKDVLNLVAHHLNLDPLLVLEIERETGIEKTNNKKRGRAS